MIESTSVTQVENFSRCQFRWLSKTIRKRKEPERTFSDLGTRTHAQLKHYSATGENVLSKLALPGMKYLPPPKQPGVLLEWGLNDQEQSLGRDGKPMFWYPPNQSFVRAGGIPFIGFFDLMDPNPDHVLSDGSGIHEPFTVECLDHKTGKSFRYAKKAEELLFTPQMCGYGMFAITKFEWATAVRLSHVNYLTDPDKAPEARKETIVVTPEQIRRVWATKIDPLVEQMNIVSEKKDEEVEGNLEACGDFGGCAHKAVCPTYQASLTTQGTLTRMKNMGLFQKKTAAGNPAVNGAVVNQTPWIDPGVPAVPAPPAQAVKGFPPITDHVLASSAQQGHKYIVNGVETLFMMVMGTKAVFAPTAGGDPIMLDPSASVQVATAAAPVAAAPAPVVAAPPPPPAPVQAASPVPPPPPAPPVVTTVRDAGAPPPPVPLAAEAAAPPAAAATEAPKRGRGRPRKDSVPGQTIAAAQAATGFRLFINAVPSEAFTDLIGYVYEATGQLEEQFGVSDIRCVGDDVAALAFGKYKGALASMVKAEPPPPGTYVAFTEGNEFTAIVAEALASTCAPGQLVRGVR